MAIRINLKNDIDNVSLQIGDVAYYVEASTVVSGTNISVASNAAGTEENIKKIGVIQRLSLLPMRF